MSQLSTGEYRRLEHRLGQARRAWKRTEMLSGSIVVLIEILGAVALAVLADVLFALNRPGRLGLFVLVAIALLVLLARHLFVPLFRRITDAQLALYLEERNPEFEGALIAAVEFGADRDLTLRQREIIEGILREAVLRVEHFDLSKALDFRRFRKYGILALALLALYGVLMVAVPESVGRHMARVVAPWKTTPEEIAALQLVEELKKPISFSLSRGDTRMLRGSTFNLEATLSRKSNAPVHFHFRSIGASGADASWKELPMQAVERLNGYEFTLPDVNEDLQFFVASGEFQSPKHRLSVFDPLILQNTRLRIHNPEYTRRPDETISAASSPDVAALVGSHVTVTFESNRPLKQGRLVWDNGTEAAFAPDATNAQNASASFDVKTDATYTYTLTDIDGQVLESPGPVTVHALADQPPTLKLLTPEPMVMGHALTEFLFSADIKDDVGLAGTDLVFTRGIDPTAKETRLALPRDQSQILFMLESVLPAVQPGDMFTCYLECRDLKGQKAVSDLVLITVLPFDMWNAWQPPMKMKPEEVLAKIEAILAATWALHAQKDYLAPVDFARQTDELAASMIDPETHAVQKYVDTTLMRGEPLMHANKAIALVEKGHEDLAAHRTEEAIGDFRAALSELALAGLSYVKPIIKSEGSQSASAKKNMMEEVSKTEATAEVADMASEPAAKAEAEKDQADQVEKILKKQQEIVEIMKNINAAPPPPPPEQKSDDKKATPPPPPPQQAGTEKSDDKKAAPPPPPPQQAGTEKQDDKKAAPPPPPPQQAGTEKQDDKKAAPPPPPPQQAGTEKPDDKKAAETHQDIAEAQKQLAAKAKELAEMMSKKEVGAKGEGRMDAAARNMFEASAALQVREKEKATQKAETAVRDLEALVIELKARSEDELGRLLDAAERAASMMLKEQAAIRVKTEALANEMGRSRPNAVQSRSIKILTAQQAQINANLEPFAKMLTQLNEIAKGGQVRPGTAKQLEEADLRMSRARVPQKAANATIELVASHPGNAVSEQRKAEEGLGRVLEAIRIANDARAAGYEAELKRAKGEADRIVEALDRIEGGDSLAAATAADEAQRLARHLQQRDLTKGDEQSAKDAVLLGTLTTDLTSLQTSLKRGAKQSEFAKASVRLQGRLDADYQALLAAKKLYSSQREECPPQYRQLVNQYFETLSNPSSQDKAQP